MEKFFDEYVFSATNDGEDTCTRDGVLSYSVNLMASFLLLDDLKDAVKSGNGEYLAVLRKEATGTFLQYTSFFVLHPENWEHFG